MKVVILAGGLGHHESSRIWIYDTNIDKVVFEDSLHGESIKFASFSSDENNLLTTIRERVTLDIEREIECSFGLWENESDVSFYYSIKYTHFIQKEV